MEMLLSHKQAIVGKIASLQSGLDNLDDKIDYYQQEILRTKDLD